MKLVKIKYYVGDDDYDFFGILTFTNRQWEIITHLEKLGAFVGVFNSEGNIEKELRYSEQEIHDIDENEYQTLKKFGLNHVGSTLWIDDWFYDNYKRIISVISDEDYDALCDEFYREGGFNGLD